MVVARDHGQADGFKETKALPVEDRSAERDAIFSVYNYDDASTLRISCGH